ncbi:4'-phosphopantetheinyl transferase superfamily protein [Actinocorallia sp. API 0066]|uniref:4'-phosphopantetheinyl transferase family protein n=1 Tax=Actinocorallia sp. API 0066 TaxID=2896846 RepID=UPI001E5A2697|nr:4'-phosphopantetheinyl transferase superfamily protein [Actinocorallia sp. API 0066]MCD0448235.1 4'-phosphopantetheinyl transferase superfamily protein [Actinocorallia sp. API 0066]
MPLGRGEVRVWWAVADGPARPPPDPVERRRYDALRSPEARRTFALGCALLRAVAAEHLGCAPGAVPLDRRCAGCGGPHGKPRVVGAPWLGLSLSHDGPRAVCAVARDLALGVDLESGDGSARLARRILSADEAASYRRCPPARRPEAIRAYWTRKEAVLKATGDGLRTPMRALTVSAPDRDPELLAWHGRSPLPPITLHRLHGVRPEANAPSAVLAALGRPPSSLGEFDAAPLLGHR